MPQLRSPRPLTAPFDSGRERSGNGVTQFTRADDSPLNIVLTGRTAARFKETITRGTSWAARNPGPLAVSRRRG